MGFNQESDKLCVATNSAPTWHGMENRADPDAPDSEWLKKAGLDFEVIKTNLENVFEVDGVEKRVPYDGRYGMIRSDNYLGLGVFSNVYKGVQPKTIFNFCRRYLEVSPRFELATAAALKGGRVVYTQAKFENDAEIIGAKHIFYATIATSYDGTLATTVSADAMRAVCENTLAVAVNSECGFKIRHREDFSDFKQQEAIETLAKIAEGFEQYKQLAEELYKIKLGHDKTAAFFAKLLDAESDEVSKRKQNTVDKMLAAYRQTLREPGTEQPTAWTALNAVTRFVDHSRTTRKTVDGESELSARMYSSKFGSGGALKQKAVSLLLNAA